MTHIDICISRCEQHIAEYGRLNRLHRVAGNLRLLGIIASLVLLWLVESRWPSVTWFAVASLGTVFVWSSRALSSIEHRMGYALLASQFHLKSVKSAKPASEDAPSTKSATPSATDPGHPFASDIDLFEHNGLLGKLSACTTVEGMKQLVDLLAIVAGVDVIRKRQVAVRELAGELELRERIFVEGSRRSPFVRTDPMLQWASKELSDIPAWFAPGGVAVSLSFLASAAALALMPSTVVWIWALTSVAATFLIRRVGGGTLKVPTPEAEGLHVDFAQLEELVRILEAQEFKSPLLRDLARSVSTDAQSASMALARLRRIITLYEARRNQFVALLGPLVLYETQLSLLIEKWRARHGPQIAAWIRAVAQLEAFASLGGFAFVRETYVFPELSEQAPLLLARQMGHPLLGESAVGNDLTLNTDCPILFVSGANMAGKSTLLRTIGVNVSLAYAGAPVRATSMTMSDLALFTSIRGMDSLQRGDSRFSAELGRIRLMLESVREGRPTLVLIDELFGGTNSYDRFAGAAALTEHLLEFDSVLAVLSTHDRNVTRWAGEHSQRIRNMHFRDVVDDGTMTFDYKLHDGPATHGNAIQLMRLAGIPVREHHATAPR